MPLPGGPSDKYGNRYEQRWTVRCMFEILSGNAESIRLEPPGEDCIEFRLETHRGPEVHQVKRGNTQGRWTVADLKDVLGAFGHLLQREPDVKCVFVSSHAAAELQELAERAQGAQSADEFKREFLTSKPLSSAVQRLAGIWQVEFEAAWNYLRRIRVETIGDDRLATDLDALLASHFDGPGATVRAVLAQLAFESIHQRLDAPGIAATLASCGIRSEAVLPTPTFLAPPAAIGMRREPVLELIASHRRQGARTIYLGGVSGIGKSTIAAQYAERWDGPTLWIDCDLTGSANDALVMLLRNLQSYSGGAELSARFEQGAGTTAAYGKALGKILGGMQCLLVWDGLPAKDADEHSVRALVEAIGVTIVGGLQLVTEQQHPRESGEGSVVIPVPALESFEIRSIACSQDPRFGLSELRVLENASRGNPYVLQMLASSSHLLAPTEALGELQEGEVTGAWCVSAVTSVISAESRKLLQELSVLEIPFKGSIATEWGYPRKDLLELASRFLVIRAGGDRYQVHEVVRGSMMSAFHPEELMRVHGRIATYLLKHEQMTWRVAKSCMHHARLAGMDEHVRTAASNLLRGAMEDRMWPLAAEAAHYLARDPIAGKDWYVHYLCGRAQRLDDDLEGAAREYEIAASAATKPTDTSMCLLELAAVLVGGDDEARGMNIYRELSVSGEPSTKAHALGAIALIEGRQGNWEAAQTLLKECIEIAQSTGDRRAEIQGWQTLGFLLAGRESWEEAYEALRRAFYMKQEDTRGREHMDLYGWYHLSEVMTRVQKARGDEGAVASARNQIRFGARALNARWTAEGLIALTSLTRTDYPELKSGWELLGLIVASDEMSPRDRINAAYGLAVSKWTYGEFEEALEAVLDCAALVTDSDEPGPSFCHVRADDVEPPHQPLARPIPGFGAMLLLPRDFEPAALVALVDRVIERRPELANYAVLAVGQKPAEQ